MGNKNNVNKNESLKTEVVKEEPAKVDAANVETTKVDEVNTESKKLDLVPAIKEKFNSLKNVVLNLKKSKTSENESKTEDVVLDSLSSKVDSMSDSDVKLLAELLVELNKKQDEEAKYAKSRAVFSLVASILSFGLVIICMGVLLPNIMGLIKNLNVVLNNANDVVVEAQTIVADATDLFEQTEVIMGNLEKTTNELAETDITGMMADVSSLVENTQVTLNEAMGKITSLDIDSMNKSIKDLGTIVEPMARMFGGGSSNNTTTKKKSIFGF